MPLDSFARAQVKTICGDVHPSLGKLGSKTNAEMSSLSADEIKRLASEGKPRRFLAAELLYSWTVEPEKWDDVPFLLADDETLRTEVLGVPLLGEDGSRLRYVSPRQVRLSKKFDEIGREIEALLVQAQKKQKRPEFTSLQEKVKSLDEALELFLQLSYDPARPGRSEDENRWLAIDFVRMRNSWDRFVEILAAASLRCTESPQNLRAGEGNGQPPKLLRDLFQLADTTDQAMREFATQWGSVQDRQESRSRASNPQPPRCGKLMVQLDATMRELAESELPDPASLIKDDTETIQADRQNLSRRTMNLALQAAQVHYDVYSAGGEAISIVPAMEPTAFEADRYRSEIRPWISLHALLRGSPSLLDAYPPDSVQKSDPPGARHETAYFHRGDSQSASQFARSIGAVHGRSARAGRKDRTPAATTSHCGADATGRCCPRRPIQPPLRPMPRQFTIGSIRSIGRAV